jgi:hypothetical protein
MLAKFFDSGRTDNVWTMYKKINKDNHKAQFLFRKNDKFEKFPRCLLQKPTENYSFEKDSHNHE